MKRRHPSRRRIGGVSSFECSSLGEAIYDTTCVSSDDGGLYTFIDATSEVVKESVEMSYYTITRDP